MYTGGIKESLGYKGSGGKVEKVIGQKYLKKDKDIYRKLEQPQCWFLLARCSSFIIPKVVKYVLKT